MNGLSLGLFVVRHKDTLHAAVWILALLFTIAWMQNRDIEAENQRAYVQELESVVAKCTNHGDNTIVIDNEVYFCGAVRTGVKL